MEVTIRGRTVRLTNLDKVFWPALGLTKGDLLRYYGDVASVLVPYLEGRAMVMKRYPNGITGKMFFMKRTPAARPDWLVRCCIRHGSGNEIDFPVIDDEAALLWVINLGCIDLNPWYSTCDDVHKPDVLHFDLDPTPGATFDHVRRAALLVRRGLEGLGMTCVAKTSGSRGVHVYVPIVRGPDQKEVWTFAKRFAISMAKLEPAWLTAEYRVAHRPPEHVLVDYNQNAWGRTLASVYSVRPTDRATVSTPVTWQELEDGVAIEDFTLLNVPARVKAVGDLWRPVREPTGRFDLRAVL